MALQLLPLTMVLMLVPHPMITYLATMRCRPCLLALGSH
jgi:hypothetical protein